MVTPDHSHACIALHANRADVGTSVGIISARVPILSYFQGVASSIGFPPAPPEKCDGYQYIKCIYSSFTRAIKGRFLFISESARQDCQQAPNAEFFCGHHNRRGAAKRREPFWPRFTCHQGAKIGPRHFRFHSILGFAKGGSAFAASKVLRS